MVEVDHAAPPAGVHARRSMLPGAPQLHGGKDGDFALKAGAQRLQKIAAGCGDVAAGFAEAKRCLRRHVLAAQGRARPHAEPTADRLAHCLLCIHVRTSNYKAPLITKMSPDRCRFEAYRGFFRCVAGSVEQELLTEDLCVLAVPQLVARRATDLFRAVHRGHLRHPMNDTTQPGEEGRHADRHAYQLRSTWA